MIATRLPRLQGETMTIQKIKHWTEAVENMVSHTSAGKPRTQSVPQCE